MGVNGVAGRIILHAVLLFAASEALHKAMLLFDLYVDAAHWFAVLSRLAIYVYIAFQAQQNALRVTSAYLVLVLLHFYEYVLLGLVSVFVFFLVEQKFDLFHAVIGVLVSYPIALIVAVAAFSLAYALFGWMRSSNVRGR